MGKREVSEAAPLERVLVVGGAGFIGSHVVARLLARDSTLAVGVYDNFSSGRRWHLAPYEADRRLSITVGDVGDLDALSRTMEGFESVVHLASNPDIARAVAEPAIDFDQGTLLTHHVIEAMRRSGATRVLYASGSGVYGDLGEEEAHEDYGPLIPASTYGASKLAGEALIAAYCALFGLTGCVFRFGNVVGPHQTHGVGLDFIRRLLDDPAELTILGDGNQSKSYVYVSDIIDAVFLAAETAPRPYAVFNVATEDYVTVREIADLALDVLGLPAGSTEYKYTGGDRGWAGDVPVVRLNSKRIRTLGWTNHYTAREALRASMASMLEDIRGGKL
jgi:UDP-glucose 4-epimerase